MIDYRPHDQLPGSDLGWLRAKHHFPVDGQPDPAHAPVRSLFVWNDDEFAAGSGFPLHYHRDVEIITYVRSGKVTHKDTLGNAYDIEAGDVQVMTAGTGIRHSEFNHGKDPLEVFQIWLAPNRRGVSPSYATGKFPGEDRANRLMLLASGLPEDAGSDALLLQADARLFVARLDRGRKLTYAVQPGRALYLVPARGELNVNGLHVSERDGVALSDEAQVELMALADTELVMAEMA